MPTDRSPRVLGLFAHPDDEVFCVGGTIAACAAAGAVTGIASLTQGESGQIRDARAASRRTLGAVRVKELEASANALDVDQVACLDLGDGRLSEISHDDLTATVQSLIEAFEPDVVVTFGRDGGFGHPDHIASCLATVDAVRAMAKPPRLLHAKFPITGQLMVDLLVDWLAGQTLRFHGDTDFGHALKLFADGTSMLGVAADHVRVEWYAPGSYIIEQDEAPTELFCILSGTADVVIELGDGGMRSVGTAEVGGFVGEEGLGTGSPRNAHVIARTAVTCLVLSAAPPSQAAGRGADAIAPQAPAAQPSSLASTGVEDCIVVNVRSTIDQKIAALTAHRSQYALEPGLLPRELFERLLGTEHFVVADLT
jgi:LmbE family N-acetylglucosaminyl deacetylase